MEDVLDRLCSGHQKVFAILREVRDAHRNKAIQQYVLARACERQAGTAATAARTSYFSNQAISHQQRATSEEKIGEKVAQDVADLKVKILEQIDICLPH